jgi:hypothetical protein
MSNRHWSLSSNRNTQNTAFDMRRHRQLESTSNIGRRLQPSSNGHSAACSQSHIYLMCRSHKWLYWDCSLLPMY